MLLSVLFLCLTASAQLPFASPETQNACKEWMKTEFPASDRPTTEEAAGLAACVSEDLYYGIGRHADPVKARKCAYLEMNAGTDYVFSGRAVLMMIYANGKGVRHNTELALRLACEIEGAPAEIEGRIARLQEMKQGTISGEAFDLCDDITSSFMSGACAIHNEKIEETKRQKRLNDMVGKWSPQEKDALKQLQRAFDRYVEAHGENEVDASATAAVEEKAALRDEFLETIKRFDKGQLPRFTSGEFTRAEGEMQAFYEAVQSGMDDGSIAGTADSITYTQSLWLKYRDAWVAFGQKRYPSVSADSWKTWLTRQRSVVLKSFLPVTIARKADAGIAKDC